MTSSDALSRIQAAFRDDVDRKALTTIYPAAVIKTKVPAATAAVSATVSALLSAGKEVPADVAAPILDAERDFDLQQKRVAIMNLAIEELKAEADDAAAEYVPQGFKQIETELLAIFDEVRAIIPAIGGASTAEQAISAGTATTDAWRHLTALSDLYVSIRQDQLNRTKALTDTSDSHSAVQAFYRVGLFRNSLDLPFWLAQREAAAHSSREPGASGLAYYRWLHERQATLDLWRGAEDAWGRSWWPDPAAKHRVLIWLAQNATPWAPTPDQLEALGRQAQLAVAVVHNESGADAAARALRAFSLAVGAPAPL